MTNNAQNHVTNIAQNHVNNIAQNHVTGTSYNQRPKNIQKILTNENEGFLKMATNKNPFLHSEFVMGGGWWVVGGGWWVVGDGWWVVGGE